jgi:ABC-type polysaccharide/polyol phosphate export permease
MSNTTTLIKVLYAQTILGLSCSILNPGIQIIILRLFSKKLSKFPPRAPLTFARKDIFSTIDISNDACYSKTVIILSIAIYYRVLPAWNLLLIPLLTGMMMSAVSEVGMRLSSMAIMFHDMKVAL